MQKITHTEYGVFEQAYDWFNADLFGGQLPAILITFQRKANSLGYFSGNRFVSRSDDEVVTDELAMNPAHFDSQTDLEIFDTLVHEMCHVWQHHFGKRKSHNGYHNREWARKMEDIGLMPSHTGKVGGRKTGIKMSDYIIPGGRFEVSAKKLMETGLKLNWQSQETLTGPKPKRKSKVKFSCPDCGQNAWGKPDLNIVCGECSEAMLEA